MFNPKVIAMVGVIGFAIVGNQSGQAAAKRVDPYYYKVDEIFEVSCEAERLFDILYAFEHLQRFMTDVKSLQKSNERSTSYWVTYRYEYLVYRSTLVFLKSINKNKSRVEFKLLFGHDNVDFLPELIAVDGYYEVKKMGPRRSAIVYHQSSRFDAELGSIYRYILTRRTLKFLKNLHVYIEEQACPV